MGARSIICRNQAGFLRAILSSLKKVHVAYAIVDVLLDLQRRLVTESERLYRSYDYLVVYKLAALVLFLQLSLWPLRSPLLIIVFFLLFRFH